MAYFLNMKIMSIGDNARLLISAHNKHYQTFNGIKTNLTEYLPGSHLNLTGPNTSYEHSQRARRNEKFAPGEKKGQSLSRI